ncbi:hypothetical protein F0L74_09755 [Chitinophaga agrisoli]|uniref:Uncharacterized protein n=1 Tax=Chitinophaga agrisoli TaxID=2607653 RepID=A0A5B2VSP6_9BACT|nr:hypothetical protein [Chitinophaga agrisoli]KAA2242803.1 hypothetical protein F0L74_09755 [Chitinophaga agrisoli]
MPATPLINGINYSWANISWVMFGVPVVGITKISYKRKLKKDNNYGFGQHPISRGYGNYEYEGSVELYTDEWKRIIAASPDRDPLAIGPFDIQVVFQGSRLTTERDVLRSVEFMEDPLEASQGDSKLLVTIPLIIAAIER